MHRRALERWEQPDERGRCRGARPATPEWNEEDFPVKVLTVTAPAEDHARIAVIGLGNVLVGDDGFGPFVIELLRASWEFPECVALVDLGTPGLGLVTYFHNREMVILVDAVGATGRPGELRLYRSEDLRELPPKPRVTPHDPAVQETLWITELAGCGPRDVLLVGVIPESLDLGAGLSAPVRQAASAAAALVVSELAKGGTVAAPQPNPRFPDVWWMRKPHRGTSRALPDERQDTGATHRA